MKSTNCIVENCEGAPVARSWCNRHYHHWRKHGRLLTDAEIFEARSKLAKAKKNCLGKHWKIGDTSKMKGRHVNSEFTKGSTPWNKGIEYKQITGEKNSNWKGDEVSYRTLHKWVERHLGKGDTCQYCKESGLSGRKIHWANISRQYKRDTADWLRLCAKCHGAYDSNKLTLAEMRIAS